MLKGSLISIILLVIIYQVYIIYYEDNIDSEESVSSNKPHVIEEESNIKQTHYETSENFEHPVLGKPDKIIPEGYLFNIKHPHPWNVIVFNPNNEMKYLFIIKMNIDEKQRNIYSEKIINWYNIIPGVSFNKNTSELVIPAPDENSALAVTNLILNNLKGDLDFKNIIENKLIGVSLAKIRNYPSIRTKIIEQVIENINGQVDEINGSLDYEEDLAETINTIDEENVEHVEEIEGEEVKKVLPNNNGLQPGAYEGTEFSYI